jgi:long-chain acyl-CoA synthetase
MGNTIETLGDLCLEGARAYKNRKALELCRGDRLLETVNFRTLALRAGQMAGLFHSLGIRRGQRVMILAENRPEWPAAVFGLALAGAVSLPLPPEPPPGPASGGAGGDWARYCRDIGEGAGIAALCITRRAATMAAGMDPGLPRIYLDSAAPGKPPSWAGITAAIRGREKQLPLPRIPWRNADRLGAGEEAVRWPDGTQSSHRELLALAGENRPWPRLFPRDRLISLCSLAEKGAFILAILAAVRGGASLSCVETSLGAPRRAELLQALELLRPTVLVGDGNFLEELYAEKAAPLAEGPLSRNFLTRPLARRLGGRGFIKSLGGNIRFYGIARGPSPDGKAGRRPGLAHLPWARVPGDPPLPQDGSATPRQLSAPAQS